MSRNRPGSLEQLEKSTCVSDQTNYFSAKQIKKEGDNIEANGSQIIYPLRVSLLHILRLQKSYSPQLATAAFQSCLCCQIAQDAFHVWQMCSFWSMPHWKVSTTQPTAQSLHRRMLFGKIVHTTSRRNHRKNPCRNDVLKTVAFQLMMSSREEFVLALFHVNAVDNLCQSAIGHTLPQTKW